MRKIAFFDIDGTLTSEIDGSIPKSTIFAIQKARTNGHLMYINTGRCLQNVEQRFRDIGFDGYVCGCGTNIYCDGQEIFHLSQSHEVTMKILNAARIINVDIIFESKKELAFDLSRPFIHSDIRNEYYACLGKNYIMPTNLEDPSFVCDKFCIWFQTPEQLSAFRKVSDLHFDCIDRSGHFREFVPKGYSKATGLQRVLDYYHLNKEDAFAFGDSNNDLTMLSYLPNSVAMGNARPASLLEQVSYITNKSSENGIENALKHFQLI